MPPLIFIHGASCSARVWQGGFLQAFRERGHACQAIDLPGHHDRLSSEQLDRFGLADYVAAIDTLARQCAQPPVLIGHSMGGYLAQRYVLEGGRAAGLVLLAAAPPQGMARELLNFALRHPLLAFRLDLSGGRGKRDARLNRVRGMLCTEQTPQDVVASIADQLQPESARALRELSLQSLPARPLPIPLLIHAGGRDPLISVGATRAMAQRYGVTAHVHADMAHMLQMEPGWQGIAQSALAFLDANFGQSASGATEEQVGAA